jgi:hypothetical protein
MEEHRGAKAWRQTPHQVMNHLMQRRKPVNPMFTNNISQFTEIARKNRQNYFPGDSCVSFFDCTLICP